MPWCHPVLNWKPWRTQSVRRMTVDNHAILYMVYDKSCKVLIIRIIYGARDPDRVARSE